MLFLLAFWPNHAVCRILVPDQRIGNLCPSSTEVLSLNHWIASGVPLRLVRKEGNNKAGCSSSFRLVDVTLLPFKGPHFTPLFNMAVGAKYVFKIRGES